MLKTWKEEFDRAVMILESGNARDALEIFSTLSAQAEQPQESSLTQYSMAVCQARLGRIAEATTLLKHVQDSEHPLPSALELLRQLQKATLPPSTPSTAAQPAATVERTGRKLQFLCVHDFCPDYFTTLSQLCQKAGAQTYAEQLEVIRKDGLDAAHMYPFYMPKDVWQAHLIIFSHASLQQQWWQEFGEGACPQSPQEMLKRQIEIIRPDVLYISNPTPPLDSAFFRQLTFCPKLLCGWRCVPIPQNTDWSLFDIILGDVQEILNIAKKHGARNAVFLRPSFPRWLGEEYHNVPAPKGVLFVADSTGTDDQRTLFREALAEAAQGEEPFEFNVHSPVTPQMSPQLESLCKPQLWGAELYKEMRSHRIVLNTYDHHFNSDGLNMRLLEGLGLGCFLLNEYVPGIEKHFELDTEIVCFRTAEELIEKTRYYLAHEEERQKIVRRGQEKLLAHYALEDHILKFSAFFVSALQQKEAALKAAAAPATVHRNTDIPPASPDDVYDKAYRWGWEHPEHKQKVYLCYKTPDYVENARRFFASAELQEELRLLASLGKPARREVRVLDFGCGNGIASYALARAGYDVTAMDSSTGEIAGINAALQLQNIDGACFTIHHSTSEEIPFPEASFDVVWMREALHHMHDLPAFVRGVRRILKPGGVLCCLRDPTIFNEDQRAFLFATHPFYHITHDEGCYYLREYHDGFRLGGMELRLQLDPFSSPINTYPVAFTPGRKLDEQAAAQAKQAVFLYSFFAVKPLAADAGAPPPEAQPRAATAAPSAGGNSAAHPAFPGAVFGTGVQITGVAATAIGEGSCIGDNCWLNANVRDNRKHLRIGRCALIGRGSVLNVTSDLEIGDFTFTGANVLISEAYHRFADITRPYLAQGVGGKGGLTIEENCWLSFGVMIYGHLVIGRGSVLGAGAIITQDVPPFSVVVGNPQKIVRMYNPQSKQWEGIHSESDRERVEEARIRCPLPGREEYRAMLWKNSPVNKIDPLCAGRGVWV